MSVGREKKKEVLSDLQNAMQNAKTVLFATYHGVDAVAMSNFRKKAKKSGVYLSVAKNNIFRLAAKDSNFVSLSSMAKGPLIYAISDDNISAMKFMHEFIDQSNGKSTLVSGMYDGSQVDINLLTMIATLPSKEELISKLLATMKQVPTKFVRLLSAIKDTKI